jgi:hypothetical protein
LSQEEFPVVDMSKVVIEGSQDSREMTKNDLKVINEKVIAVLRIV